MDNRPTYQSPVSGYTAPASQSPQSSYYNDHNAPVHLTTSGGLGGWAPQEKLTKEVSGPYEKTLVDAICAPGGAGLRPSKVALNEFCQKVSSLATEDVCSLLEEKLIEQTTSWQVRLKALYVIEALLTAGVSGVADFFIEHPDSLQSRGVCDEEVWTAAVA
eukprot:c9120_g1_i1.p1 GENE.c9120_g1_i1~~c9120_g1_i1.p1  ORF type:complete len:161 (-),score=30.53 c9120_g1_i1:180-662(-)